MAEANDFISRKNVKGCPEGKSRSRQKIPSLEVDILLTRGLPKEHSSLDQSKTEVFGYARFGR